MYELTVTVHRELLRCSQIWSTPGGSAENMLEVYSTGALKLYLENARTYHRPLRPVPARTYTTRDPLLWSTQRPFGPLPERRAQLLAAAEALSGQINERQRAILEQFLSVLRDVTDPVTELTLDRTPHLIWLPDQWRLRVHGRTENHQALGGFLVLPDVTRGVPAPILRSSWPRIGHPRRWPNVPLPTQPTTHWRVHTHRSPEVTPSREPDPRFAAQRMVTLNFSEMAPLRQHAGQRLLSAGYAAGQTLLSDAPEHSEPVWEAYAQLAQLLGLSGVYGHDSAGERLSCLTPAALIQKSGPASDTAGRP